MLKWALFYLKYNWIAGRLEIKEIFHYHSREAKVRCGGLNCVTLSLGEQSIMGLSAVSLI